MITRNYEKPPYSTTENVTTATITSILTQWGSLVAQDRFKDPHEGFRELVFEIVLRINRDIVLQHIQRILWFLICTCIYFIYTSAKKRTHPTTPKTGRIHLWCPWRLRTPLDLLTRAHSPRLASSSVWLTRHEPVWQHNQPWPRPWWSPVVRDRLGSEGGQRSFVWCTLLPRVRPFQSTSSSNMSRSLFVLIYSYLVWPSFFVRGDGGDSGLVKRENVWDYGKRKTKLTSMPLASILSCLSGFVQCNPA